MTTSMAIHQYQFRPSSLAVVFVDSTTATDGLVVRVDRVEVPVAGVVVVAPSTGAAELEPVEALAKVTFLFELDELDEEELLEPEFEAGTTFNPANDVKW